MDDAAINREKEDKGAYILETLKKQRLLLNTRESCKLLNIKPKTLYSLIQRGEINRHPSIRKILISFSEIERFALGLS